MFDLESQFKLLRPKNNESLRNLTYIKGTAKPCSYLQVIIGENDPIISRADAYGDFCVKNPYVLNPGTHWICVISGNDCIGIKLHIKGFVVDTDAPLKIICPKSNETLRNLTYIKGIAKPCSYLQVIIGENDPIRSRADSYGDFCVKNPYVLNPGKHRICVLSGKDCTCTKFHIEGIVPKRPIITRPIEDEVLKTAQVVVTGKADPCNTVMLQVNNQQYNTVAGIDGSFSFTLPDTLADGAHTLLAKQRNTDGIISEATSVSFTIDTVVPLEPPTITKPIKDEVLKTAQVIVAGKAEPGNTIMLQIGDLQYNTVVGTDSSFSFSFPNSLEDGAYTLLAKQKNASGLVSEATSVSFTIDTTVPLEPPTITKPIKDEVLKTAQVIVAGKADPGNSVMLQIGDLQYNTVVGTDGSFSFTFPDTLADGAYTLLAKQKNASGLVSEATSVSFTIDTAVPLDPPTITKPIKDEVLKTAQVIVAGKTDPGNTVMLQIGDLQYNTVVGTDGSFSFTFPDSLEDGAYTLLAKQKNANGLTSEAASVSFTIDTVVPLKPPEITKPTKDQVLKTAQVIVAGKADPGNTVMLQIGDLQYNTVAGTDGSFSFTFPDSLEDGAYTLLAKQKNDSGLVSEATSVNFTIDTVIPLEPPAITSPAEDAVITSNRPYIIGTGIPGAIVKLSINEDGLIESTSISNNVYESEVSANGTFSIRIADAVPDGIVTISVFQTLDGRTSNTVTSAFIVDTSELSTDVVTATVGTSYRSVNLTLDAAVYNGEATVYYLLLPPGSPVPTEAELLDYPTNHEGMLQTGESAWGKFAMHIEGSGIQVIEDLTGRGTSLVSGATGVRDGFYYDIYVVVHADGISSGVLAFGVPLYGMPFDGGEGTEESPYEIRPLTDAEISAMPDLAAGSFLNDTGVDRTAKMLENIRVMALLYDESGGLYGDKDALALHYVLTDDIDLGGYADANGGLGWIPMGGNVFTEDNIYTKSGNLASASLEPFTGSFTGEYTPPTGSGKTPRDYATIKNLTSRCMELPDAYLQQAGILAPPIVMGANEGIKVLGISSIASFFAGLFGKIKNAFVSALKFVGSVLTTVDNAIGNFLGSVCGLQEGGRILNIIVESVKIGITLFFPGTGPIYAAAVVGKIAYSAVVIGLNIAGVDIFGEMMNILEGAIGGAVGEVGILCEVQNTTITNVNIEGGIFVGGAIGKVIDSSWLQNITVKDSFIAGTESVGGVFGYVELDKGIFRIVKSFAENIRLEPSDEATGGVGGLIGFLYVNSEGGYGILVEECGTENIEIEGTNPIDVAGGVVGKAIAESGQYEFYGTDAIMPRIGGSIGVAGGFVGYASISSDQKLKCKFTNCHVKKNSSVIATTGLTGGFVGSVLNVIFEECESRCDIYQGECDVETIPTGGFVGSSCNSYYEKCYSRGFIDVRGSKVGGFVGSSVGSLLFPYVYNLADKYFRCGSMCGMRTTDPEVRTEDVSGVGGFMGAGTRFNIEECFASHWLHVKGSEIGGLVGHAYDYPRSIILNSYSNYELISQTANQLNAGGLVGHAQNVHISNCYFSHSAEMFTVLGSLAGKLCMDSVLENSLSFAFKLHATERDTINRVVGTVEPKTRTEGNYVIETLQMHVDGEEVPPYNELDPDGPDGKSFSVTELHSIMLAQGFSMYVWTPGSLDWPYRPFLRNNPENPEE